MNNVDFYDFIDKYKLQEENGSTDLSERGE